MTEYIRTKRIGDNLKGYLMLIGITAIGVAKTNEGLYEIEATHEIHSGVFRFADVAFISYDDAIIYRDCIVQSITKIYERK